MKQTKNLKSKDSIFTKYKKYNSNLACFIIKSCDLNLKLKLKLKNLIKLKKTQQKKQERVQC